MYIVLCIVRLAQQRHIYGFTHSSCALMSKWPLKGYNEFLSVFLLAALLIAIAYMPITYICKGALNDKSAHVYIYILCKLVLF